MGKTGPKPGSPRIPGSGRKAGTPNKATADLKQWLGEMGYGHPVLNMAALAMRVDPKFEGTCVEADLGLAGRMHEAIARYVEPQRKAIEVSTDKGKGDFTLSELLATMKGVVDGQDA